jgi:4-amino-4-deoxy-L-arabinose transferase-like glycosyltransferase
LRALPAILTILLVGFGWRAAMLGRDVRFHPDEALYATYARSMALHGDWLIRDPVVPLDKPPLGLALTAAGMTWFGVSEFGARLPTVFVSLVTLALIYRLVCDLYVPHPTHRHRTALLAALLVALSPFELAFAATLFHDPLLTLWLLGSAWGLCARRWRMAGVMAALSVATKQSAVQFLAVFMLVGLLGGGRGGLASGWTWRAGARFLLPLLAGVMLLAVWSAARAAPADFWSLGVSNPGGLRLIRADEVGPRLARWSALLGYATGGLPVPILVVLACLPAVYVRPSRPALTDTVMLGGVLGTLLLYWLVAFNTYDRYLLPLMPLIMCLVARGMARFPRGMLYAAAALVVALIYPVTLRATSTGIPIGGEAGAANGIERLAAAVRRLPPNAIVHHFWVDWALGFYLGDPLAEGAGEREGGVERLPRLVFQPSPEAVARYVCDPPQVPPRHDAPHTLALPAGLALRWTGILRQAGITLAPLLEDTFVLYRVACDAAIMKR